jgi:prepilin-type N-terminal cleavage/methylation domain-containing protein
VNRKSNPDQPNRIPNLWRDGKSCRSVSREAGFTLLELILASAISALVLGVLTVCLTFTLRAWESQQNRKQGGTPPFVDLLKMQLQELDTTSVVMAEADGPQPIFVGRSNTISFATAHSIKAISKGVPVVARYIYDAAGKKLYYAEMLLNPYAAKSIRKFLEAVPAKDRESGVRFYVIDVEDFAISYGGAESHGYSPNWEVGVVFPAVILVRWKDNRSDVFGQVIALNSPFPVLHGQVAPVAAGALGTLGEGLELQSGE